MADKKKEQIKLYVTLGLAVLLLISAYFRIIRPKTKGTANATASGPGVSAPAVPAAIVQMPTVKLDTPKKKKQKKQDPFIGMSSTVRDIFAEPKASEPEKEAGKEAEKKPPPPPTSLKGTIVGGKKPIAIINGRFVHVGEQVGEYRVVRIDKNEVLLSSGEHEIVLEVLKNVHN
jgi:hypothetical protein